MTFLEKSGFISYGEKQGFSLFKKFTTLVENQTGKKIK